MRVINGIVTCIEHVNSWNEGIALSVIIFVGGCALILGLFAFRMVQSLFEAAPRQRVVVSAPINLSPPPPPAPLYPGSVAQSQPFASSRFGKPRIDPAYPHHVQLPGEAQAATSSPFFK